MKKVIFSATIMAVFFIISCGSSKGDEKVSKEKDSVEANVPIDSASSLLRIGVNINSAQMELRDEKNVIFNKKGNDCSFDKTVGYYSLSRYNQPNGDYQVLFSKTAPDEVGGAFILLKATVNDKAVELHEKDGKKAVFIDLDKDKTILAYYGYPSHDTSKLSIGVNIPKGYMEVFRATDMTTAFDKGFGHQFPYYKSGSQAGYYVDGLLGQPHQDYVIRFKPTTSDGYALKHITVNNEEISLHNKNGKVNVYIDLDKDKTILAYYSM